MKLFLHTRKAMLLASLLVLCIISWNTHPTVASAQGIALYPDHGIPGASVNFQGVWWYLPSVVPCWVEGKPVLNDGSARCGVFPLVPFYGISSLEPKGRFTVANVSPGQFQITVATNTGLTATGIFTVDDVSAATTETKTSIATVTVTQTFTYLLTRTVAESRGVHDYLTGRALLLGLVVLFVVLVVALGFVLRRTVHGPPPRKKG